MLGYALTQEITNWGHPLIYYDRHQLDISNQLGIYKVLKEQRPSIVLNCTAKTNVDLCEDNEEDANLINGTSVGYVADLCKQYGIKFFHMSTDYVFDGMKEGAYTEEDIPSPVQAYGRSKLMGERLALENGAYVFRIQALYGHNRKNTTDWIITSTRNRVKIPLSVNQIASPCSTFWLAKTIFYVMKKLTTPGLYHLSHDNYATRYQIAEYIVRGLNENPENILQPMIGANFGKATRPIRTILANQKLSEAIGMKSFGTWEKDLTHYVRAVWKFPFYGRSD